MRLDDARLMSPSTVVEIPKKPVENVQPVEDTHEPVPVAPLETPPIEEKPSSISQPVEINEDKIVTESIPGTTSIPIFESIPPSTIETASSPAVAPIEQGPVQEASDDVPLTEPVQVDVGPSAVPDQAEPPHDTIIPEPTEVTSSVPASESTSQSAVEIPSSLVENPSSFDTSPVEIPRPSEVPIERIPTPEESITESPNGATQVESPAIEPESIIEPPVMHESMHAEPESKVDAQLVEELTPTEAKPEVPPIADYEQVTTLQPPPITESTTTEPEPAKEVHGVAKENSAPSFPEPKNTFVAPRAETYVVPFSKPRTSRLPNVLGDDEPFWADESSSVMEEL
jgi:hypothetical protein